MEVFIDNLVHQQLVKFYESALRNHITLDEVTVCRKMDRIYDALDALGKYAYVYSFAKLKKDWIEKGYREFIFEDFHFAYQIYQRTNGIYIVRVHEACHSLTYK